MIQIVSRSIPRLCRFLLAVAMTAPVVVATANAQTRDDYIKALGVTPKEPPATGQCAADLCKGAMLVEPQPSSYEVPPPPPPPVIDCKDCTFNFNSTELDPAGKQGVQELGAALASSQLSQVRVILVGHTDAVGGDDYNRALSLRRAIAVRDYLNQSFGIPLERVEVSGVGKDDLKVPTDPTSGKNRRVQIVRLQ